MKTVISNKYQYEFLESQILTPDILYPYEPAFDLVYSVNTKIVTVLSNYIGQYQNAIDEGDKKFLEAFIFKYSHSVIIESDTLYYNGKLTSGLSLEDRDAVRGWILKFIYIYNKTKDRYHAILNAYESNKAKLMNDVESMTETRFHDTPQNIGYYGEMDNTSNITQSRSKSQVSTPISRIGEIERAYSDVLDNWVNEFKDLFIEY